MEKELNAGGIQERDRAEIKDDSRLVQAQQLLHSEPKCGHLFPVKPCRQSLNYHR